MGREFNRKRARNKTIGEIYEAYRDEMQRTLGLEETAPQKFLNVEFVEHFARKVERLDTLISLYADLLLTQRTWN